MKRRLTWLVVVVAVLALPLLVLAASCATNAAERLRWYSQTTRSISAKDVV